MSSDIQEEFSNSEFSTEVPPPTTTPRENPPHKVTKKSSKTKIRSKTGCFTCRFRKKKCDESNKELNGKCNNCNRNSINCVWPSHNNETLPKEFKLSGDTENFVITTLANNPETVEEDVRTKDNDCNTTMSSSDEANSVRMDYLTMVSNGMPAVLPSDRTDSLTSPISSIGSEFIPEENHEFSLEFDEIDNNSSQLMEYEVSPLIELSGISEFDWIPNYKLNKEDAFLYHLFLTEFIPSISPSHSHPSLTPAATFLPQGLHSNILLKIFFACGACVLAYNKPEYRDFAQNKYLEAIQLIQSVIMSNQVDGTEDWLFVAVQSLCLRERAFGASASRCAKHLVASYNIIKRRLESKLIRQAISDIIITPVEKCLLESFIFNYSITLFLCDIEDLKMLPNPFIFFETYNSLLERPLFSNCLVKWMNNPVMGAAFEGFEIAAKTSYMFRKLTQLNGVQLTSSRSPPYLSLVIPPEDIVAIHNLQQQISHFRPSTLPNNAEESPYYNVLVANIAISKIVIMASSILLMKLLDTNLPPSSYDVQSKLKLIIEELKVIPNNDHSSCLTIWSILVVGSAAVKWEDQNFLRVKLADIGELIHANSALQVKRILETCWKWDNEDLIFGMLFDRKSLEQISA